LIEPSALRAAKASGYTKIYSNENAFAVLEADGSITMWGWGGADDEASSAPTDSGYTKIYSNNWSFVALKADGSITAWGGFNNGGTGAPTDSGYIKIYSTMYAFAAVKADGSQYDLGNTGLMHEFQFEYFRGFVTFLLPYSKQPK
jgi:hypothetical protein